MWKECQVFRIRYDSDRACSKRLRTDQPQRLPGFRRFNLLLHGPCRRRDGLSGCRHRTSGGAVRIYEASFFLLSHLPVDHLLGLGMYPRLYQKRRKRRSVFRPKTIMPHMYWTACTRLLIGRSSSRTAGEDFRFSRIASRFRSGKSP